jgi:hypothetical protein
VVESVVGTARELDEEVPGTAAYHDAVLGEARYSRGALEDAARLGAQALQTLPAEETLLRYRVMAWTADALWRLGRTAEAIPHYTDLAFHFPTPLRMLDLALPVEIVHDGSAVARLAVERLSASPRLRRGPSGLKVEAAATDTGLRICLTDGSGTRIGCGEARREGTDSALVTEAIDAFHAHAFSPRVRLTEVGPGLDGSSESVDAKQALQRLLGATPE